MRLDANEARRRFATAEVARLATVESVDRQDGEAAGGARPHLVPVTFAPAAADTIVIGIDDKPKSTADLKRLRNIAANPSVALLADRYDPDWTQLWWSRADGTARTLTEGAAHAAAWDRLRARYPQYAGREVGGPVIEVTVRRWTGWAYR